MKKETKTIRIHIPKPCSAAWNEMHTLPDGRFCDSCEKTVIDFSQMTDNELVMFFQKNNHKVCGSFRPDQLNRNFPIPKPYLRYRKWKSAAAIVVGLLAWNAVGAQTPILGDVAVVAVKKEKNPKNNDKDKPSKYKLKGVVKDKNGEPLIGASILLEKNKGTITDIDGKFELEIPEGWESFEITFSYIGYETQVIEFDKKEIKEGDIAAIKMKESVINLTTIEVIGNPVGLSVFSNIMGMSVVSRGEKNNAKEEIKSQKENEITISKIYPNPFVDFVNVVLQVEKEERYLFHLYNSSGQLIWAKTKDLQKGKEDVQLNFSAIKMAQGNYFLRITNGH
ncbi:MAG TPA: T9SS type A sorting domain-containing protein, partial [Phaeodactylibacter sp.]|nr:T9SS type A sorting domain-containing protein [Phaeodactylibacter sp.]